MCQDQKQILRGPKKVWAKFLPKREEGRWIVNSRNNKLTLKAIGRYSSKHVNVQYSKHLRGPSQGMNGPGNKS